MFTMKKFATLATVGFFACSMLACGDDPDECEDDPTAEGCEQQPTPPSTGDNWALSDIGSSWSKKVTVQLGGSNNSSLGSSVDIDPIGTGGSATVYKIAEATTNKDKVDLLFDGTNIFTPEGCNSSASCPANFKTAMSGYVGEGGYSSELFLLPVSVVPANNDAAYELVYDANDNPKINKTLAAPVQAKPAIYYAVTAKNLQALILVGGGNFGASATGETTLTILVGAK